MANEPESPTRSARLSPARREHEAVMPLELFFDLVFVLGFTQCTALMSGTPTWEGLGRGVLVLAILWWAWVGYAWLTSVIDPEEGAVRIVMFSAMAGLIVVALCVPEAFGDRALTFAVAYGFVRAAHIALFVLASRDDPELRHSVIGLALSTGVAVGLLIGGAFLDSTGQAVLWTIAMVLDWGVPAVFGVRGWKLAPGHFAERHGLVIILALGESIIAIGVASSVDVTAGVITAAVLGIALAAALWWIYFDVVSHVTAWRLARAPEGRVRNAMARDSYSYLHFPMVAGIVLTSLGLEEILPHVDDALDGVHAFAFLGGIAVYLLAHVALRLRNAHTVNRQRLVLAFVFFALIPVALEVPGLAMLGAASILLWAMIAYEATIYARGGPRRYRLRHGLELEPWTAADSAREERPPRRDGQ